jgi:oxaloacetate decarboxylase alpha subunit
VSPLANGTSQPSTEQTVANLRANGFTVSIDDGAVAETASYFTELAARLGRQVGVPREYDARIYRHQLPGGMTSTLQRQLDEIGMADRWDDVLAELPRVREELGWPIMVTPLSQYVGVQAFLNVTTGERWSQIPDEVQRFVLGRYGEPAGEIDPGLRERVLASPRADELAREEGRFDLGEARARYGDAISDELLLLRMMLPEQQVDAMLANRGGLATPTEHPLRSLVAGLAARRDLREIAVDAPGVKLRARARTA